MKPDSSSSSSIEEELTEFDPNALNQQPDPAESVESQPSRKRGRPRIPEQWTQVLSLDGGDGIRMKSHLISTDLLLVQGIPNVPPPRRDKKCEPFFFSKSFVQKDPEITLEKYQLSAHRLKVLGI